MKRQFLIILVLVLSTFNGFAQKKTLQKMKAQAIEIKGKTLTVVLNDESNELEKTYNKEIRQVIEKEWTYNKNIDYISFKEYKTLRKKRDTDKVYLIYKQKLAPVNSNSIQKFETALVINSYNNRKEFFHTKFNFSKKTSSEDFTNAIQKLEKSLKGLTMYDPNLKFSRKEKKALLKKAEEEFKKNKL